MQEAFKANHSRHPGLRAGIQAKREKVGCIKRKRDAPSPSRQIPFLPYNQNMPNYRRLLAPGGTYFFTVNLLDRSSSLLTSHIEVLRRSYAYVQNRHPFETIAIVVLPDHFHCLWSLPAEDADFSLRMRLLKERFTKSLPRGAITRNGRRKGERGVWQRRFWEHLIRDDDDFNRHVDYIHFNPVRHGHVNDPDDWPYSTWHEWKKEYGRPVNVPPELLDGNQRKPFGEA